MAVNTPTSVLNNGSGTDGTLYTTASFTPPASALLILFVSEGAGTAGNNVKPTIGGTLGLTWTEIITAVNASNNLRGTLWWAVTTASPPTGTLTFTHSATQSNCQWLVTGITGTSVGSPIAQSESLATAAQNPSLTLDNAIGSGNATLGFVVKNTTTDYTAGSGYTILAHSPSATAPVNEIASEYQVAGNTTVNFTTTTTVEKILFGIEVRDVAAATLTPGTTTNVGVAVGRTKARTLGPGLTTNVGVTLGRQKSKTPSATASTETAVALMATKARTLTPATETDTAVALTKTDRIESGVNPPIETDTAVALVRAKARTLTPATESDVPGVGYGEGGYGEGAYGGGLVRTKRRSTLVTEADTAVAIEGGVVGSPVIDLDLTPVAETDTATSLTQIKSKALTPATETDTAVPLSVTDRIERSLTPATETDTGPTVGHLKLRAFTPADEADAAAGVARLKAKSLTAATETDAGVTLTAVSSRSLTSATETEAAVALQRAKTWTLTPADETDTAVTLVAIIFSPRDITLTGTLTRRWRATLEQDRDGEVAPRTRRGTLEQDRDATLTRTWKAHVTT